MAYETIDFKLEAGIARLTLNRPDRLNSFTVQMHEEVADALAKLGDARCLILTGAGRGFCAGQDLNDRAVAPGEAVDLGESVEQRYNPLIRKLVSLPMPVIARVNGVAAGAGRQYRSGLRHRDRREEREVHPELRRDRPDPGQRRHLGAAAAGRPGAGAGAGADRRAAAGREGGRMGPDLEGGRRRPARRRGRRARRALRRRADPRASPGSRRCSAKAGARASTPSSTASATRCASWAIPTIIARASRRSWRSGSRTSPGK